MDAPDDAGDDPYAVLGLAPDAGAAALPAASPAVAIRLHPDKHPPAAALRRAYRRLALRLHPDKDPSAATLFARLQAAWAALGSPEARAAHDAARAPAARAVVWMDVPLRAFAAGGAGARSYPCRCGGAFEIFDDEPCADGDLVPCDGCSAHVRLVM